MYFVEPEADRPLQADLDVRLVISGNALALLVLGLLPGGLLALCARVLV